MYMEINFKFMQSIENQEFHVVAHDKLLVRIRKKSSHPGRLISGEGLAPKKEKNHFVGATCPISCACK